MAVGLRGSDRRCRPDQPGEFRERRQAEVNRLAALSRVVRLHTIVAPLGRPSSGEHCDVGRGLTRFASRLAGLQAADSARQALGVEIALIEQHFEQWVLYLEFVSWVSLYARDFVKRAQDELADGPLVALIRP